MFVNRPRRMTATGPYRWLDDELVALERSGLCRRLRRIDPLPGGKCLVDGRECWNFSTNDYLGLAADPRLAQAAVQALQTTGSGSRASPLVSGRTHWHERLEDQLARFKKSEAALLFSSGYAANVGTVAALVGPGDIVWCDRLNHASLVDGCRLSGAKLQVYPHIDVEELRRLIRRSSACRRRLIVTDSLFSMDGDIAPLSELAQVAEEAKAMLLVDEAHATGIFGSSGAGLVEEAFTDAGRAIPECLICIGTLSKALGGQGGFLTGPRSVIDWCVNRSRSLVFSTALCPGACASALAALEIVQTEPGRRTDLQDRWTWLQGQLANLGIAISARARGPILPVVVGSPELAMTLSQQLLDTGFLVPGIRPPSVSKRGSRLRISLGTEQSRLGLQALALTFGNLDHFRDRRPMESTDPPPVFREIPST